MKKNFENNTNQCRMIFMKTISSAVLIIALIIGGAFLLSKNKDTPEPVVNANNVTIVDGKQIIEITAKGGYLPRVSTAKADVPTVLRLNTQGTFDCSSSVRIPTLSISKNLPPSGVTDIDLGAQKVGTLDGTCGMGMYPFEIVFES